jgi:hypothetical protein
LELLECCIRIWIYILLKGTGLLNHNLTKANVGTPALVDKINVCLTEKQLIVNKLSPSFYSD